MDITVKARRIQYHTTTRVRNGQYRGVPYTLYMDRGYPIVVRFNNKLYEISERDIVQAVIDKDTQNNGAVCLACGKTDGHTEECPQNWNPFEPYTTEWKHLMRQEPGEEQ